VATDDLKFVKIDQTRNLNQKSSGGTDIVLVITTAKKEFKIARSLEHKWSGIVACPSI
jgi:hypothetical protein